MLRSARRAALGVAAAVSLSVSAAATSGAEPTGPLESSGSQLAAARPPSESPAEDHFDDLWAAELSGSGGPRTRDPLEPANRKLFALNEVMDQYVWDPLVRGYRFVVPEPGRRAVRRFFLNLNAPAYFANDLLQLRFLDAAETAGCFTLNTAFGLGGLFSVGKEAGWQLQRADFGQTLARAGVSSGPYLVLPILGPSTLRDGLGDLVDQLFNPLTYVLGPADRLIFSFIEGSSGFTTLDANREQIDALRESSVDFYAAMRSAYLQNREAQIWAD